MAKSKSRSKSKSGSKPKPGAPDAQTLTRIANALERLAPRPNAEADFAAADAFIWQPQGSRLALAPVPRVNRVEMTLLKGIDRVRDTLMENTERFAKGLPANNALLWGARGMGKSSLVKASHAAVNASVARGNLKLVEIHREDIESLPELMALLRGTKYRFIVFCDDLSFDAEDTSYKSLKAVLEGGIEGRPENVILYATSNRRHLMSRDMMENERSTAINPGRDGRGEGFAVGPLRPVARLSPLQPGRISRHGRGLRRPFPHSDAGRRAARRGAGMGHHARLALRPRGVAIRAGSGGTARREAVGLTPQTVSRCRPCRGTAPDRPASSPCGSRSAIAARRRCRSARPWR